MPQFRFILSLLSVGLLFPTVQSLAADSASLAEIVQTFCVQCHNTDANKGGLNLAAVLPDKIEHHTETWERVVRRLRARQMPPAGHERPDEATYRSVLSQLTTELDRAVVAKPRPGRTATIRRLTRTEYQNAIHDLLALEINAATWLPADEISHGFDNVTVGELSPTLLDRYITAAQKISKLAIGGASRTTGGETIRVRADITQEDRVDGLPFGTRGGTKIRYLFPQDGKYDVQIRLARDRNEHVEGLHESHELDVLLDGRRVQSFTVTPPPGRLDFTHVDDHLTLRLSATAGPHDLGVTFLKNSSSLLETLRQPYNAHFNTHRHPRLSPAVFQVSITGPFEATGPGDTPSRRRIFASQSQSPKDDDERARQILSTLMRRAYRRPITDADLQRITPFFYEARRDADFDAGIEAALSAILVSREFLFRVESDPVGLPPRTAYRVPDVELASRLSFFLWSSIPDDELLAVAERGELHSPEVLSRQTRRLLTDPRSRSLITNFAAQWLYLRNLDSITPDGRLFPDFDDNLRQAMRRETELLFEDVLRDDRSALELLKPRHIWLNERLAKHYSLPHVYGSRFRRVPLTEHSERGGLLRQGSLLTVTSYATRTSPVLRGKWILENLVGTPPPPPPPDVPTLDDNIVAANLPVRERLLQHRANAACAVCHDMIDPVGFALENFDAVGRWRSLENDQPIDASGGFPNGDRFVGVNGLEASLLQQPELFVGTLAEKLLTFALGRGLEASDGPAIREIVRSAQRAEFRFSALVEAIVHSSPFQMRSTP